MKNLLLPITIIDNQPLGYPIESSVAKIMLEDNVGIMFVPDDDGEATISVQVSLDGETWTDMTLDPVPALDGSGEPYYLDLNQLSAFQIKVSLEPAMEAVFATLVVQTDILYTANEVGEPGNDITIRYIAADSPGPKPTTVTVAGTAITVHLGIDEFDGVIATMDDVMAALADSEDALALITPTLVGVGGHFASPFSVTPLSGGFLEAGNVTVKLNAKGLQ